MVFMPSMKAHDPRPLQVAALRCKISVYVLGVFEVLAALALIVGIGVRYVGLLVLALVAETLTIFVISPAVTGFPFLNMAGQFLLKDLILFAATFTVIAADYAKAQEHGTEAQPDLRRA